MKDRELTGLALRSRGVALETMGDQDQTTLAMYLLYQCQSDDRVDPETVALLRQVLRQFPDQKHRGRPVDVVARELMARRDAIKQAMSVVFKRALAHRDSAPHKKRYEETFERLGLDLFRFWGDYDGVPNNFQSIRHASQSLDVERYNIREWRKDPEYQNLVNKFCAEYMGGTQDD